MVKVAPPRFDPHKRQTMITWIRPSNLYGPCELNALHRDIDLAVFVMIEALKLPWALYGGRRAFTLA